MRKVSCRCDRPGRFLLDSLGGMDSTRNASPALRLSLKYSVAWVSLRCPSWLCTRVPFVQFYLLSLATQVGSIPGVQRCLLLRPHLLLLTTPPHLCSASPTLGLGTEPGVGPQEGDQPRELAVMVPGRGQGLLCGAGDGEGSQARMEPAVRCDRSPSWLRGPPSGGSPSFPVIGSS